MEGFRQWFRGLVGFRSPIYAGIANLVFFLCCMVNGRSGLQLILMRRGEGRGRWLRFRNLLHPISVRPGTDDVVSIVNNILREEYGRFTREFAPSTIVDVGAYIGDTTAYFATRFGESRCIALEPNPESMELAKQNLAPYGGRVELMTEALWVREGSVNMGGGQTGSALSDGGFAVKTTTLQKIMEHLGVARLGLVKMDIEGAELDVLKSGVGSWLGLIDVLLLETHGVEIEVQVIPLLEGEGFKVRRYRNVWYCHHKISFTSYDPIRL